MSKTKDLLPEYDFSGGIRGKYAALYSKGSNVVVLSPDVSKFFKDSDSVNDALRSLIKVASKKVKTPKKANGAHNKRLHRAAARGGR